MERLQMPGGLLRSIVWASEDCLEHQTKKGEIRPVKKMIINGSTVCPTCELEKDTARLQAEEQRKYDEDEKNRKYRIFKNQSIIADESLLEASFLNYMTAEEEESANKFKVLAALDDYMRGETFNLILQGKQGTGKSHLTYSLLNSINETREASCCFISIIDMLRLIRDSYNNKQSRYTESYFVELLSSVDYLGLDDLGAETGSMDSEKTATDFVQRILYAVTNARQKKSTIITTNLSSEKLFQMYDKKLVSRLMKKPRVVIFKDTKDKRITGLPF